MAKVGKDGWIRWRGNNEVNYIPEEPGTKVEVRFRDKEHQTIVLYELMGTTWKHYGKDHVVGSSDIMAYRVVEWADGFKPWYGGVQPVEGGVAVIVKLRDGTEMARQNCAGLRWSHLEVEDWRHTRDIVAWKLADQPVKVGPQKLEAVVVPPAPPAIEKKEAPKKPAKPVGWWG